MRASFLAAGSIHLLVVLSSCGGMREGFRGDGFQKRVHRPGYAFAGLRMVRPAQTEARSIDASIARIAPRSIVMPVAPLPPLQPVVVLHAETVIDGARVPAPRNRPERSTTELTVSAPHEVGATPKQAPGPVDKPRGVFSWLAVIALVIAVGVPLVGILLESSALAIGGAAAGFILGLIASRQCRDKGRTGGGFALAALILSSLLLVLTAIGFSQGGG